MRILSSASAVLVCRLLCCIVLASSPIVAQIHMIVDEPLNPPTVIYPDDAKQRHIQGAVELEVHVSDTGQVTGVKALSGPEELLQAAVDAYSSARYRPMMRGGKAVPAVVTTRVDFSLQEAPPSADNLVAQEFEPVHRRCEELARAKDPQAVAICRQALDIASRFTPTGHMVAHAAAYNDLALALLAEGKIKEAGTVGDEAVARIADVYPGSLAAANASITRAQTRLRAGEAKRSAADCAEAERILRGLIDQASAPYLSTDMKAQLKGVLRLHAVVLRKSSQTGKAKAREDEADKL